MIRTVPCLLSALIVVTHGAAGAAGAGDAPSAPPPIPPVLSVTELGIVGQNPVVNGRDGTYSALIAGKSVWTFNDSPLAVPGEDGNHWVDNSLAWTSDLDASDGIALEHDYLDPTGAPAEFMPYTAWEEIYNYTHDTDHCTAEPCGAEFAMWPGHVLADPARNRVLVFYGEIWRAPGYPGWKYIGSGIAVGTPAGGMTRPLQNPGSPTPTLMWTAKDHEVGMDGGYVVAGPMLFSYGCVGGFLVMDCKVGRVPLAHALDKTLWRYYAGNGTWSASQAEAATVFQGGAAGQSVFYVPYLGMYMAVYSGVFSDDVYYRVSSTPWGPWSDQALIFTGQPGWEGNPDYAGRVHTELAQQDGRVQYVTYVHTTGFLQQDLPLVQVVFGEPAN